MSTTTDKKAPAIIEEIQLNTVGYCIVGLAPLIMHRFSAKAKREFLFPSGKKNAQERAETMKHDPLDEYQECFYRNRQYPDSPALFHVPSGAFEKAIAQAAIDIPGAFKAQIERLTSVTSRQIDLFGTPLLSADMVRDASIKRTPDIRFRPIFNQWACAVEIEYKADPLNNRQIANLLHAAGRIVGVGDSRPEKGGGSILGKCGKWRICGENDPEYVSITQNQGRAAQQKAYDNPTAYDEETEELLAWFEQEVLRRKNKPSAAKPASKRKAEVVNLTGGDGVFG
jgi:hypothetical protein